MKTLNIRTLLATLSLLFVSFSFTACHKEGTGGKAWVNGIVKHHSKSIPNAVVYIKYGATELPGINPGDYDDHVTADATGHYEIDNLYKGNYYLYAIGWDDEIFSDVKGGTAIDIKKNKSYEMDVPVTE